MRETSSLRKNPSRKSCEDTIRHILVTEVLTKGCNEQFKQASDFLTYFESLYPASDSLTKQIQRAVASMHLPRDERGYFIINKTEEQLNQEKELSGLLLKSSAALSELEECEPLLLKIEPESISYLMHCIAAAITFQEKYETIVPSSNGIIFYTKNKKQLIVLLNSLISNG